MGSGVGGIWLARYLSEEDFDPVSFVYTLVGLAVVGIALWFCGTVLLYVYALLLDGVEGRTSRGR